MDFVWVIINFGEGVKCCDSSVLLSERVFNIKCSSWESGKSRYC